MRVLYIDDFACNADIVRQALARQAPGIELEVADSCASARARLVDTNQARADVLLIELALPDGGGIELLKAARMADPPLPAVVILERADYDSIVRAVREGAQAYLLRQGDYLANLAALLREILDRYRCQSALMREREVLQETRENWMHVLDTSALALFKLAWRDGCFVPRWTSHNLKNILGNDDVMTEESWLRHIHPDDRERVLTARGTLQGEGKVITEYRFRHRDGHYLWLRDRQFALRDETGNIHDIVGTLLDITRDRKFGLLHDARIAVRDRIFDGASLEDVLGEIICRLEDAFPDWRAMIWLAGETSLFPALDVARTKGTIYQSGQSPAPAPASQYDCIARALVHTGQFHLTLDGKRAAGSCCNCPLAQSGGDGDGDEGVYAIWSQPLRTAAGEALGVLNFCSRRQPPPEPEMPARLEEFSFLIVMAVERTRMELKLRQAAAVLESTSEGVIITNPRTIIVSVNQAWCDITGYRREEVIGHSPAQIQPGLHDTALYRNIWKTLNDTNIWEGEISNRRKSGEIYPQFLRIRAVRDSGGMLTHYVGVMSDLSFLKKNEREREWLAHYDPLTGLPNRLLGLSRLEHAVEQARQNGQRLALICLDIDHFQTINDSLGHAAGDQLLQILSARLNECAPGDGAVFRLGGDEFMVLLENLNGPDEAARIAQTILETARAPLVLENRHEFYASVSVGISLYPEDGESPRELLQHADAAMNQAKREGRDSIRFYTAELGKRALVRLHMEARIRHGLESGEFFLHYQPQIDIISNKVTGVEALMRWNSAELGMISPGRFIPIAEQGNLIHSLGAWALREACLQNKYWQKEGLPSVAMAVNVSVRQFHSQNLVDIVKDALKNSGLDARYLEIELTESAFLNDTENAIATCHCLRDMGVKLSLDDFGTGYSSLAYLSRFPFDKIKIDQSFVHDITTNTTNAAIANATIALAHSLRMTALAEGVEKIEQLEFLKKHGCTLIQGYLFSHPLEPDTCAAYLRRQRNILS